MNKPSSVADTNIDINSTNKTGKLQLGLQGFDTLVEQYLKHKKMMPILNRLGQAKTKDFESPMLMSSAVLMAREYIGLIQKLQHLIPVIANGYMNRVLDSNARLAEMQVAANNLVNAALNGPRGAKLVGKKSRVKKGK